MALDGGIRYVRSPRHLVEVEHYSYQRELQRRIKTDTKSVRTSTIRSKMSHETAQRTRRSGMICIPLRPLRLCVRSCLRVFQLLKVDLHPIGAEFEVLEDASGGVEIVRAVVDLWVGVNQDEAADLGGGGDFGDRLQPAVAGDRRHAVDVFGKVGLVQQQIDAADVGDIVGVGRGGGVGDVGHAVAGPIEPIADAIRPDA